MKRKGMTLGMSAIIFLSMVACLAPIENPEVEKPEISEINMQDNEIKEDISKESDDKNENTDVSNDEKIPEDTDDDELSLNEEVASKLHDKYQNYLEGIKSENSYLTQCGFLLLDPSYSYLDINGDGVDDMILSGYLGLRNKELTEICLSAGDDFVTMGFDGRPYAYDGNKIAITDPDNADAGAIIYERKYIIEIDYDNTFKTLADFDEGIRYYDPETYQDYDEPLIEECWYYVDGKESTKKETEMAISEFELSAKDINYISFEE